MSLAKAFARIFRWIAALLLLLALVFGITTVIGLQSSQVVEGSVVRYQTVQNSIPFTEKDSGLQYYPVLEYIDASGARQEFTAAQPVRPDRYHPGETLELRILSGGTPVVNNLMGIWGRPLVLLGMALLFFIFGFGAKKTFEKKTAL